jgi:hypothetical protein
MGTVIDVLAVGSEALLGRPAVTAAAVMTRTVLQFGEQKRFFRQGDSIALVPRALLPEQKNAKILASTRLSLLPKKPRPTNPDHSLCCAKSRFCAISRQKPGIDKIGHLLF